MCPLCGAGLVESVPSWAKQSNKDIALVPCMTVPNVALLPYIKGILGTAGVEYFVKNDGLQHLLGGGTIGLGYSQVFGPPVVMVAADQLDRARELLNALGERLQMTLDQSQLKFDRRRQLHRIAFVVARSLKAIARTIRSRIVTIAARRWSLPNMPIKLSVRPVAHLACASCAPVRPAAYRRR